MATDQIKGQTPLAGLIMCCTSILPDQRQEIAMQVAQMGAEHKYDLTSDVTHLIIGSVTTTKYQYVARERPDVKVVLPTFIQAVRDTWLAGEEPDVAALESEHRAPPLYGLKICLTGFEELNVREGLIESIKANGGGYECDLIKGIVNILVAKIPEGRKYDHAHKWNIPVVSLKWLTDSLERGMALETAPFDPVILPSEQGEGAIKQPIPELVSLGKRQREDASANILASSGKRKLRRTMSSKLGSQQESIWADIADAASARPASEPHPEAEDHQKGGEEQGRTNLETEEAPAHGGATSNGGQPSGLQEVNVNAAAGGAKLVGIFNGVNISIHGFDGKKLAILREHLSSHGATLLDTDQLDPEKLEGQCFLIVPHDVPNFMLPPIPNATATATRVTEWWVESCMHKKTVVDPKEDRLSKPFAKLSIDGLKGLVVCSTGFKDSDLLHLSKVVRLMGGTYDEFLKQRTSVLVCKSQTTNVEKLRYAGDHSIPAVSEDWLWESIEIGAVQPFEGYTLQPITLQPSRGNDKTGPFQEDDSTSISIPQVPSQSRKSQPPSKPDLPRPIPLRELSAEKLNVPTPPPEKDEPVPVVLAKGEEAPESMKSLDGNAPIEPQQDSNSTPLSTSPSLKDSITALLAHKEEVTARRGSNLSNVENTGVSNLSRRRRGLLGRATSNASSVNDDPLPVASQVEGRVGLPPPTQSQKIGWRENGEESIGMVRDAVGDGGGAARAAGRRKKAAFA